MPITFHHADIKFSLRNRTALRKFIIKQITNHQSPITNSLINLSYIFCSDEYLLNINRQFLNHDYYTDIITFPLSEDKKHIEAEIYISIERVKENSEKFKVQNTKRKDKSNPSPLGEGARRADEVVELHRVMFHGVLHLLGYKDKTKAQKAEMRKMEDKWLKNFNKAISS